VLRPVYDASAGVDGRVSIEVDPRLARETAKTIAEARALWWMVDRPNLFIKIPATLEGLPAITQCLSEGISINVTLIFSLERYAQVIDAYMAGLEAASGRDAATIASVASFFVSRVDTEVDERLDKIGSPEARALRGTAALANARLAYELFEQRFDEKSPRWAALRARGARVQRPLWASTSVKDPSFAATMYVTELVAPHTVNTMPEATMHATAAGDGLHGYTIQGTYDASREVWRQLEELGVHYDDVVKVLEEQGVDKFKASWVELLETIGREMAAGGTTT
jgi:transaldolase